MKLSLFKNMIRSIIREELEYKFSRLRKELKEIVVKSNVTDVSKASKHTIQDMSMKNLVKTGTSNVSAPKTNNKVLNQLLSETAQSDDWKTVEGKSEVQSVQDNTSELPEHLANAFNKDYSEVLKASEKKWEQ